MSAQVLTNTRNMTHIEWLDVLGFEGCYLVSNLGDVKSIARNGTKGGLLKQYLDRYGYSKVILYMDDKPHYFTVHRLVALAFIEKTDSERNQVNHKNGIRTDNRVSNLEWVTARENIYHSFASGRQRTELCPVIATEITTNMSYRFSSQREAAKQLHLSQANIHRVLKGEYKQTGGYCFERITEEGANL